MTNPAVAHLLVALVWLFLSGNTTFGNFLVAWIATFGMLALFQKVLGCQDYVRRMKSFVRFSGRLLVDIVRSNIRIMKVALERDARKVRGCYVDYDVSGLTDFEILLLSQCVGLSPGTMVAEHKESERKLVIHAYPAAPDEEVQQKIDSSLKEGIQSFTR